MADGGRIGNFERDIEQAITALKKGTHLLKYSRKGKPRFCPFRLSNDERMLIWLSGKEENQLSLSAVSRIIPGQRTANFHRNPTPEKEYQSFSLIFGHDEQSLDLVCKDKEQAELWFVGLKALINGGQSHKLRVDTKSDGAMSSDGNSPISHMRKKYIGGGGGSMTGSSLQQDLGDTFRFTYGSPPQHGLEKTYSLATSNSLESRKSYPEASLLGDSGDLDSVSDTLKTQFKDSSSEAFRVSLSSMISSSSHGSGHDDGEALGDVYMWGEGLGDGLLGGSSCRAESSSGLKMDSLLPKHLESAVVLDVHNIACGRHHAALVSRQGEVFCWGQESGGRLGHGVDSDVAHPQLVETLVNTCVEQVACGEYHTCAITLSGDLYTWGDGTRSFGLLGQGNDFSHWMPRRVHLAEGIRISSVACGPWHTALITSAGQLFTFGDGTFGALGHGDRVSTSFPKEIESLKGLKTVRVACGVWHTAAVVEVIMAYSDANACPSGKLFTWGDADKGRLGHGDKELKSVPTCVAALVDYDFRQVVCGHSLTVALTTSGTVFTMGSPVYGQLGDPHATGQYPLLVEGKLWEAFVEEIACGSHHVAVLTSKTEVYTWGKGANGRLGHGDVLDRHAPTLVEALKDKQVKSISCGSSFTAAVCLHKWLSGADQSVCSGCRFSFGFTRKRHNCYNCGHVFCHACSSKKATKATLAPSPKKPYRVCDPCYAKLKMAAEAGISCQGSGLRKNNALQQSLESKDRIERADGKQLKVQLSLPRLPLEQSKIYEEKSPSNSKHIKKPESLRRVSPAPSEASLRSAASVSPFYDTDSSSYKRPISPISVPPPRSLASVMSPLSRRSSPPRSTTPTQTISGFASSEFIFEDLKRTNKSLTQDVLKLQAQVDSLTQRCESQEVQLQQVAKELQIANSVAAEESAKCKAAKEVIRCLTVQLKDLAEKLPAQVHDSNGGTVTPLSPLLDATQTVNFDSLGTPEVEGICFHDQKYAGNPTIRIVRDFDSNGATSPYATPNGALHLPQRTISPHNLMLRVVENAEADTMVDALHGGVNYAAVPGTLKSSEDGQITEKNMGVSRTPARVATTGPLDDGEASCKAADVSNGGSTSLANGKLTQQHVETEWVKQHEPGVYITFTSLPGGGKDLKRVRFSRKKFSEKQAEQWWAENRVQVYEQYNVRGLNNLALGAPVAERIGAV
ncbi:hypothetical protein GOP47_0020617 [Adiantum capillus-veneris]|uniref:Uncharacterized protein n=1 Tax=Adiantum capillus-veneris TaxID=13818 RepID=A0A9D4U9V2_ADICA|nr:hypothetical protein GOP47_0020617 [Adiantum capillus-veneris]